MNLPAVMLLFICFSTAYGLQCKRAMHIVLGGEVKVNVPETIVKCESNDEFCARSNVIYSGSQYGKGSLYHCSNGPRTECNSEHEVTEESKFFCSQDLTDACKNRKDGECYDETVIVAGIDAKGKVCCSKDREFNNVASSSSSDNSKKLSSTFSTRALLVIITALVASIY